MDLRYPGPLFHGPRTARQKGEWNNGRPRELQSRNASTLQAAAQLGTGAIEIFGSVASQAIRFPVDAVSTAAHLALHPGEAFNAAYDALRNAENEKLARQTRLLQQLHSATSWSEYSATCIELDQLEGAEVWKELDHSEFYDVNCLRGRLKRLIAASDRDDVEEMVDLIRCELTRDLGGICNPALHQQTRTGTKFIIDHYIRTVGEVLDRIVNSCAHGDRRLFKIDVQTELEETRRSYGRTALLLSGGGTLGMAHVGVIKALHEANALPRIISGSSSGSIVAAVLGATPDDELLLKLHEFCHGDLAVFVGAHERQGWSGRVEHFGKKGYLFDLGNLRRVMVDLLGKTTFGEAYNQTRRVLNITVSNATHYESQQVLNYATAKNVVIWSAVVASCAVPFGFEPERLLYKRDEDPKDLVPWDPSTRYVDGSINGDLPTNILSAEFDVNHSIVSQVNPHVVPFLKPVATSREVPKTPYWISVAGLAKEEAIRSMEILSDLPCLERNNNIMTKVSSILGQRYSGDITLLPVDTMARFWTILENPTPESMEESWRKGERATWPVLNMIKTHMDIELLIDNAVRKVSEYVSFSESARDLRRLQLRQARVSNHASGGRLRSRRIARSRAASDLAKGRRTDHLRIRIVPSDLQHNSAMKVPGEAASLSSVSSSASLSYGSDDEMNVEDGLLMAQRSRISPDSLSIPGMEFLTIQTQPNTPTTERRSFFGTPRSGTPRSGSPARPPMSLMMTPVTPRASSPETRYKNQSSRNEQSRSALATPPRTPKPSSDQLAGQSWRSKLFSIQIPRRIRSTSVISTTRSRSQR